MDRQNMYDYTLHVREKSEAMESNRMLWTAVYCLAVFALVMTIVSLYLGNMRKDRIIRLYEVLDIIRGIRLRRKNGSAAAPQPRGPMKRMSMGRMCVAATDKQLRRSIRPSVKRGVCDKRSATRLRRCADRQATPLYRLTRWSNPVCIGRCRG